MPGIAAGAVFAFGGAMLAVPRRLARLQLLMVALLVTSMAAAFDWIAFGPGPRHFTGGVSSGGAGAQVPVGETLGRFAFGAGGVLCDIPALYLWYRCLRPRGVAKDASPDDAG